MVYKLPITSTVDTYVGQRLKERRRSLGWTLEKLAEKLAVSHQQVHKYEQANTRVSVGMLFNLAKVLRVHIDYFFEGYTPVEEPYKMSASELTEIDTQRQVHILLVESDPTDELMLRKALESSEYTLNIHAVHNGDQALSFLQKRSGIHALFPRIDLVLLELNVPKVDGLFVLRAIKRNPEIKDIPVVIMTNNRKKTDVMEAYRNYASGFFCKDADFSELSEHINQILTYWISCVYTPSYT